MAMKTGKLYIKFVKHLFHYVLTFNVVPYDNKESYDDNLLNSSKQGYRQTPIVSLRLIHIITLLLSKGYKVSNLKVDDSHSMDAHLLYNVLSNAVFNTTNDMNEATKNLEALDNDDDLEITHITFSKGDNKIVLRNNGLISASKNIYNTLVNDITNLLSNTETC